MQWTQVLQKQLRWRKPHIVNGWVDDAIYENPYKKLWVLPTMLCAGSHEFIVRYPQVAPGDTERWSLHKTMVEIRTESIPLCKYKVFLTLTLDSYQEVLETH